VFLLVPAHPGSPRQRAIKRSLLLLLLYDVLYIAVIILLGDAFPCGCVPCVSASHV